MDKSYETEIDDRRLNRLVQRKGKYNEKYKVIIKTISKERYLLQWRDGDELKKEIEEIKVFVQRK